MTLNKKIIVKDIWWEGNDLHIVSKNGRSTVYVNCKVKVKSMSIFDGDSDVALQQVGEAVEVKINYPAIQWQGDKK